MSERILIVGGGPAGLSTARAYREAGGDGEVVILAAENHAPYRRPPLTKEFLRGEIPREDLPIEAESWFDENGVELRRSSQATALDVSRKVVSLRNGEEVSYDSCVLATGSEPIRIPVPGGDDPGILTMRTVENSTELQRRVGESDRAVVIGSGFIGCEAAASLSMRGAKVTLVSMEELPQIQRLGEDAGERIKSWLEEYGVDLRLGASVVGIEHSGNTYEVHIEDGDSVSGETVLFGTGVKPRTDLARKAGLEVERGGIVCDSSMRTSEPGVFAVGDISFAFNDAANRRLHVEHWGEALNMGRVAGAVLAGRDVVWDVAPGFWSTIGDRTLKYVAWGDGYEEHRFVDHGGGAFTVWYGTDSVCAGVLTHDNDEDYENGRELIETGAALPG